MQESFHDSELLIHPNAIVHPSAEIASDVKIGPFSSIGPNVQLAEGVTVGAHAIIEGRTRIGSGTQIYPFATVGSDPQDLKYNGEDTELIIGSNNTIREYANVSIGTAGGGGVTTIGDNNLLMLYCHIGHDCIIRNNIIFANGVSMAGHVDVEDDVVFGGFSAVHQFCHVGTKAMIAAGAMVTQDVPPYIMVHGNRAKPNGLNLIGLRRAKVQNIPDIKFMYKAVFTDGITLNEAKSKILENVQESSERRNFIEFLGKSKRGLCR